MKFIYEAVIPLTPISKKNHQRIFKNAKNGKPFIVPSKEYKEYEKECIPYLLETVIPFSFTPIDEPVTVVCKFYMPTRRPCDLTNMLESIDDILVKAGVLADDNYKIIASHDGSRVLYDKDKGRTEVTIYSYEGD